MVNNEDEDEINKHRIIYDVINDRYNLERDRYRFLGDKASNIITFVGIIMGLQGALGSFLLEKIPKNETDYQYLSNIFLLGIILLASSIICGLLAYRIRPLRVVPGTGEALIEEYGNTDADFLDTLIRLSEEKVEAIKINDMEGNDKVEWINLSFFLLVAGILANIVFIYKLITRC